MTAKDSRLLTPALGLEAINQVRYSMDSQSQGSGVEWTLMLDRTDPEVSAVLLSYCVEKSSV